MLYIVAMGTPRSNKEVFCTAITGVILETNVIN